MQTVIRTVDQSKALRTEAIRLSVHAVRVGASILIAALARFKQAARMGEMRATCPQGAAEWLFALPLHGTRARSTTCCRRGTHSDRNQKPPQQGGGRRSRESAELIQGGRPAPDAGAKDRRARPLGT